MTDSGYWVERRSALGYKYRVWRRYGLMPPIPQMLLDCSVYLYASRSSAEDGENFGGSGCLISVQKKPLIVDIAARMYGRRPKNPVWFPPHIYVVTNKHVALRGFPVVRINTLDDKIDVVELDYHDWIPHPEGDDLVVAPIDLPQHRYDYFPIGNDLFVSRDDVNSQKIGAGDDTFMVGRFINHAGKQRNTPSLRFGSIAMLPFEKVKLGPEANNHLQEAFLVETRSISGFSGSPVFVYRPEETEIRMPPDEGKDPYDQRVEYATSISDLMGHVQFLGIDCGHVPKYEKVMNSAGTPHPQGWKIGTNTGMAVVIPAWRLMDLLNKPELTMKREEKDKRYKEEREHEETVSLDVERPEEFSRASFQDALKRASRKIPEPEDPK